MSQHRNIAYYEWDGQVRHLLGTFGLFRGLEIVSGMSITELLTQITQSTIDYKTLQSVAYLLDPDWDADEVDYQHRDEQSAVEFRTQIASILIQLLDITHDDLTISDQTDPATTIDWDEIVSTIVVVFGLSYQDALNLTPHQYLRLVETYKQYHDLDDVDVDDIVNNRDLQDLLARVREANGQI